MSLTPSLGSIAQLYRKLEREQYRAYHCRSRVHKADHFFNFCVTAHSLRDYFFEDKQVSATHGKKTWHELWNQNPLLIATAEVANSAKHFILRDVRSGEATIPKTRRVSQGRGEFVDIYQDSTAAILCVPTVRPEIRVALSDGSAFRLHEFMQGVVSYWRDFLIEQGVPVRRQSVRQLIGE